MKRCEASGKVCYSSREAHSLASNGRRIRRKRSYGKKVPVRAYYCNECRFWHLTSKTKGY